MKKILIASTALVAAGFITTSTASASEKINLQLGGFSKWWVVGQWQNKDYQTAAKADINSVDVKGDNEVWFDGNTKLDNGVQVGVHIELEAGGHTDQTTDPIDASYAYVAGGFGKAIIGTHNNGTYLLHVTAPDAASNWNDGGILTAGWAVAIPANVSGVTPGNNSKNTTGIITDDKADGITYVLPTFYGLTVGGSYKPNTKEDDRGATNINTQGDSATGKVGVTASGIYGVGALYANTFGGVGVKMDGGWATYNVQDNVSAGGDTTGVFGKTGVNEYSTGLNLSYAGFTVGGSYRKVKATDSTLEHYLGASAYDAGVAYASGPYAVSASYYHSASNGGLNNNNAVTNALVPTAGAEVGAKDKMDIYQVSGKYTLGAGVDSLTTIGYGKFQDGGSTNAKDSNKGWTAMTGLSLAF